ncbi:CDP-glycerol glycerophosphotransferase family protein [Aurantibacter crassamenti]|uniref:CDP-glycerol glycerophosphotransferase family protein n=1 Tax=Aurantibacter crassamenti TaxID=1837375 RepID=UPI00193ABD0D|nr:CDP-glycerol glycerophosphotransferase family protein [Aurantibacter crassamenti]MBM1105255.1 CDP-glycerol glycerophosphotransferase family protein [Aurantibacter crassamenti]
MKRFALFLFEKIVFGFLCAFIPKNKHMVLFGTGFHSFSDNPKFLFIHFQNHQFYRPIWISSNRDEVKILRKQGYSCKYRWSLGAFWSIVRAPLFFISHNIKDIYPVVPKRAVVINLWHGTPIKKIGFDSLKEQEWIKRLQNSGRKLPYDRWDYFISASPNTSFIFEKAMGLHKAKIKSLGQPRTDLIYQASNNNKVKTTIEVNLNFQEISDKYKILYTPTFRNNDRSTDKIKQSLIEINNKLNKDQGQVILFKPHPLDSSIFDDHFFKSLDNVINVSKQDTQNLLCVADVLITDYSSIMFDFMLTGKPIISYIFDLDEYVAENGGFYFSFEEIGTTIATNSSELVTLFHDQQLVAGTYDKFKFNTIDSSIEIERFINTLRKD